jgi:hypothetical protein
MQPILPRGLRPRRPAHQNEHKIQAAFFEWVRYKSILHPELHLIYAIPNGGQRSPATAGRLKAEGVRAGVLDVCLPVPRWPYFGLYIEFKAGNGKLSPAQNEYQELLRAVGHAVAVVWSVDSAIEAVTAYLELPPVLAKLHNELLTSQYREQLLTVSAQDSQFPELEPIIKRHQQISDAEKIRVNGRLQGFLTRRPSRR